MPWFVSSLAPTGGLRHTSYDAAVYSNFWSLAAQESGSPPPSGVWSWPGSGGLNVPGSTYLGYLKVGTLEVDSGLQIGSAGNAAKELIQDVFVQQGSIYPAGVAAVFSTFLVGCVTPKFADSLLRLTANLGVYANGLGANIGVVTAHLTRGVTSAALTTSQGPAGLNSLYVPIVCNPLAANAVYGIIPLLAEEASPGSGTPLQYHLRWADIRSGGGSSAVLWGQLRIEEWR